MDLLQNLDLLGERRRALSTTLRLLRDFQRFGVTRVNRCTRQETSSLEPTANAVGEINVPETLMKSIILLKTLVSGTVKNT
jgi:hypothetical protein